MIIPIITLGTMSAIANNDCQPPFSPKEPDKEKLISSETYVKEGLAKHKSRQPQGAIIDYNIAIQLNPNFADAYFYRGLAKHELERYEEAITDYNQAIQLNHNHAAAYLFRGKTKYKLGQLKDSIKDYGTAIQLEPSLASAYLKAVGKDIQ